jgi:hypothetical protein
LLLGFCRQLTPRQLRKKALRTDSRVFQQAAGAHGDEGGPDTAVAAASDAGLSKANKKKEKKAAKKAKQHMRFDGEPGEHAGVCVVIM